MTRRGRVRTATSEEGLVVKLSFIYSTVGYIFNFFSLLILQSIVWCTCSCSSISLCVNKNGYNSLLSISAICDVKPWRLLLP